MISLCGREFRPLALCQAVLWGYRLGQNPRPCHGVGAEGRRWLGQGMIGAKTAELWLEILLGTAVHIVISYIHIPIYHHIPQSLGWSWLGWCMLMCILTWPGGFHLVSTSPLLSGSASRSCQEQSNYTQYLNVCCGCEVYPLPLLWYHTIVNFTLRYSHFNQQYFALLRSSPLFAGGILQAQKACDSRSDFFQHRKGGRAKA